MRIGSVLLFALLVDCSSDPSTGTGSQTGNSIVAGRILTNTGTPSVGAKVNLRPLSWTPSQTADSTYLRSTLTDSTGEYEFRDVPIDTYRVEARRQTVAWSRTVRTKPAELTSVPAGTLVATGKLMCEIEMADSLFSTKVELYGLDRSYQLPVMGHSEFKFMIDSLPVGLQTVRIWSMRTNSVLCDLPVRIGADSVSKVEYEQWGHDVNGPREDD